VYAADFALDALRRRCAAVADALLARGWSCLVACDTRFMSNLFAREVYHVLSARGVPTSLAPSPAPLAAVQHALDQRRASCALVVTARNKPYWHNGLVLLAPQPEPLLDAEAEPPPDAGAFPPPDTIEPSPQDLRGPYLELLRGLVDIDAVRRTTLTVFVDPMHGTTASYLPAAIGEGGQTKAIEINRETDPLFGKATPHPAGAPLTRLRKLVRESDSHVGLALSADGSAIGVVDNGGESVPPCYHALLLASYLARQHRQRGQVIVPLPAGASWAGLNAWEDPLGLKVHAAADPAPLIADALATDKPGLVLACGADGEIVIGRQGGAPDALHAALLTLEMLARSGGKLRALLDELTAALRGK
jgi:phosphomannomutase